MPNLISVTISPPNPFILTQSGLNTQQFVATANFSDAAPTDITNDVTTAWDVGATGVLSNAVASVSNTTPTKGLVTANTISGSTVIRATYGGFTGSAILRVGLANYIQIWEQLVEGLKISSLPNFNAHNPIARLTVPNYSLMTGGVAFLNSNGISNSVPIGWTTVSGHPDEFATQYITKEQQYDGYWVGIRADGYATSDLSLIVKNLGIVTNICVNSSDNPLTHGGYPVFVQLAGENYVYTQDSTIVLGDFLGPDTSHAGAVMKIAYNPASPTPILGFALESYSATYQNMIKMRIQICGE
jgi:hypothetical protein